MTSGLRSVFGAAISGDDWAEAVKQCSLQFLRNEGDLAVVRAEIKQEGHVITAWEAWKAYGQEIVDEAIEYGSAILREGRESVKASLAGRRKELGLTNKAVAALAGVTLDEMISAETDSRAMPVDTVEKIAFCLGLDERLVGFRSDLGEELSFGKKLGELGQSHFWYGQGWGEDVVGKLAEAASVIRVEMRLRGWLGQVNKVGSFSAMGNRGGVTGAGPSSGGYALAEAVRSNLGMGKEAIVSMRDLVVQEIGVPVVMAELPLGVSGVTLFNLYSEEDHRGVGIVLNSTGDNLGVWDMRVNLARELGRVLLGEQSPVDRIRMNSYWNVQGKGNSPFDETDERADAFALAFLAPLEAVKERVPLPVLPEHISGVMRHFGMSEWAARKRIESCYSGEAGMPLDRIIVEPPEDQIGSENVVIPGALLCGVKECRSGGFTTVVMDSLDKRLISKDTAALYLGCSQSDLYGSGLG